MIRKEGTQQKPKYVLYTSEGSRKLGEHRSREGAERQERAIQAARHARGGKR